jgi:hypothetical protein
MAAQIDETTLAHFTGTERYFRHWTSAIIYTDGIEYLNANGAGWLVDAIASHQHNEKVRNEPFQLWELKVNKGKRKAVLTCKSDSDQPAIVKQLIEYTNFPLESIQIYVELGSIDGVKEEFIAMLPSER